MLKEEVGKRMKEARIQSGLTQQQIADKLGVAQPVYQRFEKGIFECSYEQIVMICDVLDVTADYLLGRTTY